MLLSLQWLRDFLEVAESPAQLADRFTALGLEVEGKVSVGQHLAGVEIVEILQRQPHPNADKLGLVTVRRRGGETPTIVCGAANVRVGDKVPMATVGARLPKITVQSARIRGIESLGLLCSAQELGLAEEASGLMVLPPEWPLGPLNQAFNFEDTVLEMSLTPNRGDCLSVFGLARELAAATGRPLRKPSVREAKTLSDHRLDGWVEVSVEDFSACPRYIARAFQVQPGPSPFGMQYRLQRAGLRPINQVVDVTNYVLMELGQPLHAFDADRLAEGRLEVRSAREGEVLAALDGKEYRLVPEDLVIADGQGPVALAGIMGGQNSAVHPQTTRMVLESAQFDPRRVRRSARRLGLHSESSHRFERGIDPDGVPIGSDRAAALLTEAGGSQALSTRIDLRAGPPAPPRRLTLRPAKARLWLGADLTSARMSGCLTALGFGVVRSDEEAIEAEVPSWRNDIDREIDLVEEVARLHGLDNLPTRLPPAPAGSRRLGLESRDGRLVPGVILDDSIETLRRRTAHRLNAFGYHEAFNLSFAAEGEDDWTGWGRPVRVANPLAPEQKLMRRSLLPALLRNLRTNFSRQVDSVRLFEMARVYREPDDPRLPSHEEWRLALAACGPRLSRFWSAQPGGYDFYDLKAALTDWLEMAGALGVRFEPGEHPLMHPGKCAALRLGGRSIGHAGEIHPRLQKEHDLPSPAVLAEIDLEAVQASERPAARPWVALPRFPATDRDLALVVERATPTGDLLDALAGLELDTLEEVYVFDHYEGQPIPEGKKSVGLRLRFRHPERTLTEGEIVDFGDRCLALLKERFRAERREG